MAKRSLPSPSRLRQLLSCDAATGILTWQPRSAGDFRPKNRNAQWVAKIWNSKYAGKTAGRICENGYVSAFVDGLPLYAHRVAWAIHYGSWPLGQIDHENGIRDDNRIENLRDVSGSENSKNSAPQSNNSSGQIGVSFDAARCLWFAYIFPEQGKRKFLGRFRDFNDAVAARKRAEKECGYHENHGSLRRQYR